MYVCSKIKYIYLNYKENIFLNILFLYFERTFPKYKIKIKIETK